MFKSSHRPDWKVADVLASTLACTTAADALVNKQNVRAAEAFHFPITPMGDSRFACCLQGGGVYVSSGTVAITHSSITGNTAVGYVRAKLPTFKTSHRSPRWENC
jgi:hypothetical protein